MKHYKEQELKAYAAETAKSVVIRTYREGSSVDTRRRPTATQARAVYVCLYGALLAANCGDDPNGAISSAEFIVMQLRPEVNSYDSVYIPFWKLVDAE